MKESRRALQETGTREEAPVGGERRLERGDHEDLVARAIRPVAWAFGIDAVGRVGLEPVNDAGAGPGQQLSRETGLLFRDGERAEREPPEAHLVPVVLTGLPAVVRRRGVEPGPEPFLHDRLADDRARLGPEHVV